MCVVAVAWKAHPRWLLVMAGNRDEFHDRPASALDRWPGTPGLIGGQDLQSGGMWLGISEQGRFAVVTNVRNPDAPDPTKASRGALVRDWLAGEGRFAAANPDDFASFNPFQMFVASASGDAAFLTNRPTSRHAPLPEGMHALSNGLPDEHWPRKTQLEATLAGWIAGPADQLTLLLAALAEGLERETTPGDSSGAPFFLNHADYGTRCSTVIAIDHQGKGQALEHCFGPSGIRAGESRMEFTWPVC